MYRHPICRLDMMLFLLVRGYLYDLAEAVRLEGLAASTYAPLAAAAQKLRPEEKYHLMHGRTWVQRLALGSEDGENLTDERIDAAVKAVLDRLRADLDARLRA